MDSVRVTAMLDSGAVSNFIDVSVWKQLGKPITCTGDDSITAVNGQLLTPKTTEASLGLGFDLVERSVSEPFSVGSHLVLRGGIALDGPRSSKGQLRTAGQIGSHQTP